MIFIDTNIAIDLRDIVPEALSAVALLDESPLISMITRIELENGILKYPEAKEWRQELLARFLETIPVIMFTEADIDAYAEIIAALGFDRRLTLDRLIAAQVIARNATLITRNGRDFRRIPGLRLIEWETPAAG